MKFDTNGGSSKSLIEIDCGSSVEEPKIKPEKDGFEFINWTYNNVEFDFSTKIYENITLVANYSKITTEEIVVVSFNSNGGGEVKSIESIKGVTIIEPVSPSKDGYVFEGWYLNDTKFDFSKSIDDNITLIAKWSEKKNTQEINSSNLSNNGSNNNQSSTSFIPALKPNDENKYRYVGEAILKSECSLNDYEEKDGYCYRTTKQEEYLKCDGREIDGVCYKLSNTKVNFSCPRGKRDFYEEPYCLYLVGPITWNVEGTTCHCENCAFLDMIAPGVCSAMDIVDKYEPTISYECNDGEIKLNDNFCGVAISYKKEYKDCPSGSMTSDLKCWDLGSKTKIIDKYVCEGFVDNKPKILLNNKCYIEN